MKRLCVLCLIVVLTLPIFAQAAAKGGATARTTVSVAQGERRTALVIGNGSYKNAPLANPVRDARLIAEALLAARFRVIRLENASRETMLKAIAEFGDEIDLGGVGVFYYAGHGVQVRGENYLMPVDAKIDREEEIRTRSVNAQEILDRMAAAKNGLNLVFLDACRNDPYPRASRGAAPGLARMDAALGTLVSFATAPGSVAEDGGSANSPYSRHLAAAMHEPGLRIEDVLKRVRSRVREDTHGRQITWDNSSIEGEFYFHPGEARATTAAVDKGPDAETAFWNSIRDSGNPREFELYLKRYPDGEFADLAGERLAALEAANTPEPPPQPRQAARTGRSLEQPATHLREQARTVVPARMIRPAAQAPTFQPGGGNAAAMLNAMGIAVAPTPSAFAAMQRDAAAADNPAASGDLHALAVETFPRVDPDEVDADDIQRARRLRARLKSVRAWSERKVATRSMGAVSMEWLQQVQLKIEDKRLDEAEAAIRAKERALGLAR